MADRIGKPVSQRQLRVGEMIRQSLGMIFARNEAKVPNLETNTITVTEVKMSQDLKIAKAYVLPLGGKDTELVIKKLKEYSFLIRKALSKKIIMKYLPKILFAKDDSFEYAEKIENLIKQTNIAPRGTPQIEVAFDIDANGILNVSAKDKATGKEQSIIIKASSGLSEEEIQKMVQDAETHAEEDKKAKALVDAKNNAEAMIHASEKSVKDLGDKADKAEVEKVNVAIKDLQEELKADDAEKITEKTMKLTEAAGKIAEQAYKEEAAKQQGAETTEGEPKSDDNVVDADFTEVKEEKEEEPKAENK